MPNNKQKEINEESLDSNSTYRTMKILETLSVNPNLNLDELAPLVKLSKPTLFRFLHVLSEIGYIEKNRDNRYSITPKLFKIASRSLAETELSRIAQPYMEDFSLRTGETVILTVLDSNSALYLNKIESKYEIKFYERIGKRVPLYCTSAGKILLSGFSDEDFERYLASEQLIPYTQNTIVDKQILRKNIQEIREKGFVVTESEHESGHKSIAAPIFDREHKIIASMSITWPLFRNSTEKIISSLDLLQKYTHQISILMGYIEEKKE
ncbi:MAG: IclR family transcriptional regulator [Sphaerochaeta sp.]